MFLLDTNVISELRKSSTADRQVVAWAESVRRESMYISSVTVLEIERGILRVGRRDPRQAAILHDWLRTKLIERFSGRILSVDMEVALRSASLHVPDPKPELDAMIAATALVHGLILVTRNVSDFERTSVALLNPWD